MRRSSIIPSLSGKPAVRRIDQHANGDRSLGDGINQNEVSARWTGYFTAPSAGDYLLFMKGPGEEGGTRLYLDDKLVIDNWELVKARASEFKAQLTPGPHKIRLEYFRTLHLGRPERAIWDHSAGNHGQRRCQSAGEPLRCRRHRRRV